MLRRAREPIVPAIIVLEPCAARLARIGGAARRAERWIPARDGAADRTLAEVGKAGGHLVVPLLLGFGRAPFPKGPCRSSSRLASATAELGGKGSKVTGAGPGHREAVRQKTISWSGSSARGSAPSDLRNMIAPV